jgi:ABC-2 type transport system permease protein
MSAPGAAPEWQGDLGRPIAGPTAFGSDPGRIWRLTWTMAVTDFKLRFFGSVLGYLWQLMRPLMLFAIVYVVFAVVLKVGGDQPYFGVALLLGIVIFQFFTDATSGSVRSIVMREGVVRKVDFPRLAVPASVVLQALFNLGLNLLPVFLFLFAVGGQVYLRWLEFPLIILMLLVFVCGLAMLLSSLFVKYRDVEPIWDVLVQALFYATPILYSISVVIEKAGIDVARLMLVNPLATAVQQARYAVIDPSYESAGQIFGTSAGFLIPISISVLTFVAGLIVFSRSAPHIAEQL